MSDRHHRFVLVIVLMLLLGLIGPMGLAGAQEEISLAILTIRVWPEYDQPSALVFYIGQVAEGTTLPAELRFQLPPGAALNAAAYVDEQTGRLLTAASSIEDSVVTMISPNGSFHIEFYDSALTVAGEQRTYSLVWQGDYPVAELALEVEQPAGASEMIVEPAGGLWGIGSNGLQAYVASWGEVQTSQQATVSVSYAKADNTLTIDSLLQPSSSDPSQSAPASTSDPSQMIVLSVLIAVVLIVISGGVFYYLRRRRGGSRSSKTADQRFCTQCGQRISSGDRFCRHCGTRAD